MSGLTMLRLLLLMHFLLFTKCLGIQSEEDFSGFYDMTASIQTMGTSWRDLRPNITPTVNAEGAREEKDFFDNGDRQPDLLTSVEPDGNSSISDYEYASKEYVTTDSNNLLTSKGSLSTVKWDAADAKQENYFENIQSNNLTSFSVTDIPSNEKENIDSVESIFADSVDNINNLSSEEISTIVDVDRIFNSEDHHFSTVTFPDFSTVNSMDFHNIFGSEQINNFTGDATENNSEMLEGFTVEMAEESSGYEPLKDYFSFDPSNSMNQIHFENLEESSGDESFIAESKTFGYSDLNTDSLSTASNKVVNWIQTESTVSNVNTEVLKLTKTDVAEEEIISEDETATTQYSTAKERTSTTPKIEVHSENMEGNFSNKSRKTHKIFLENNRENEEISSGEGPFTTTEKEIEATTNLVTSSTFEVQSENVENFEDTPRTSLGSEPEKKLEKLNVSEKYTEVVTRFVTDSELSTTTEVRADILEISTETNLEDKSHRVPKKLTHFEQVSKSNFENSMTAEEIQKDILDYSWTSPEKIAVKTDVPELELHGEYVYTDVETSKNFDSVVDQNFLEYGEDGDETGPVSRVEDSLVTEQNQIEQTFTQEILLPNDVKTEEGNKSLEIIKENSFRDITTDGEDIFTSTTEENLNFIQESERTTVIETETFYPTTEIFEGHLRFSQEDESTTALIMEADTHQSLDINGVSTEESDTTTSKLENDFDEFFYTEQVQKNDSHATEEEKLHDQHLAFWTTSAEGILIQNTVDLTTLKINENFMPLEKENDNKDITEEGLTESTTARDITMSFQKLNIDVMRGSTFIRNKTDTTEFITEKSTVSSILHETEDETSGNTSESEEFESDEELTESTSQNILKDLTTLIVNQDFTSHNIRTKENSTNEELIEYSTARYTTSSFENLNTEVTEEHINFSRNEDNELEVTTKKSLVTLSNKNEGTRLETIVENASDEITEYFAEKAKTSLKEAVTETIFTISPVHVQVTTYPNNVEENFALNFVTDNPKNSNEEETSKIDVPLDFDLTTSSLTDKSETPTIERDFVPETETESLVSDQQSWKESEEEKRTAKKVPTFEDILYYSALTTTPTPVTLYKDISKYYFTEETFSTADKKKFANDDVELHLQQNTEITEDAQTTESTNKQVKTVSNLNFGDGLQEETEIEDNITINATEADHISTTLFDSIEESTSQDISSEGTSTIGHGNWDLDKNTMINLSEFKTEVNLKTTAVIDNKQKETVEEYFTKEIIDEENMTTSNVPDYSLENQDNLRKEKVFTTEGYLMTTTVINEQKQEFTKEVFNKVMLTTVSSVPYIIDLGLRDPKNDETEDKNTSTERTTEVINSVQEHTSEEISTVTPEENFTMTNADFNSKNSVENTPRFETRNTVEEEKEITEEVTTSNIKLFNKVEVETNGRFLKPQFHLDETSSGEEEKINSRKESRLGQVDKKRNENVQLDSPAVEFATEKQLAPSTDHQGLMILNKSRKIFGEMSKKIFQKFIDVTTTEENTIFKGERATETNSIEVEGSEEDDQMTDDDWIQTNGFIRKINNHRNLQNVNKTASDWEIVFDYHHHANADLSEVIVTQKRDVMVRESVDGRKKKEDGGNLDEPYLNLNLCDPGIEEKSRNCLTLGSLHINFTFDNFTTYIPPTANLSGTCNDKNHVIDVNWIADGMSNGVLSLQLHIGEVYYWINSVYFLLNLPDKRHTQISVNDLVILETQVGDHLQGTINITSTSGLQLSIRIIDLTSTKVDNCIPKEAKVFQEHELALVIGGAALATTLVLMVVVFLLYKKFRTTTSAYKMAIE